MNQIFFRLPELRARRRMSQRQVAAAAGLRPDTISALERGAVRGIQFETLARLCEVLGCEPGELFELDRDPHLVPVLGGPDEDALVAARLAEGGPRVDGPSFVAELLRLAEERKASGARRP